MDDGGAIVGAVDGHNASPAQAGTGYRVGLVAAPLYAQAGIDNQDKTALALSTPVPSEQRMPEFLLGYVRDAL